MSTRSTLSNIFSLLRDPESLIRRRNLGEPSSFFDFEETMSIPHNNQGPPPAGPPPQNNNGPPPVVRPNGPAPDLRSMEELCQPSINGRGGPIAPIPIQATDFGLRHHMIEQITTMRTEIKNDFKTTMAKQHSELKNMMTGFLQMQSPSGSGLLPSNSVANPRGDVKAITTRSGVAYDGLRIPPTSSPLPKKVEREAKETKDMILSLPVLTPTRMTLELVNQSVAYPVGVAEDVFVKVRKFYFLADFVVVGYDVDPQAITFKVGQTSRYSPNHYDESVNQINVIDVACEVYAQEVLGFLDSLTSSNPTFSDPIIASSSPSFTPFEGGDFILEEIGTFLRTSDELSNLDDDYYDKEGDVLSLEKLLNEDPSPNLPPMKNEDLNKLMLL
nr:reverse transcriptase domain-containing protein [Tanacetum cinerariifolium]